MDPKSLDELSSRLNKEIVRYTLETNRKLQKALHERALKLEGDLKEFDLLLETSTAEDVDDELESELAIPGSKKAVGLFPSHELLNPLSPFYEEAKKRTSYVLNTRPHPFKERDLEALADAVKRENERLEAYRRSRISGFSFETNAGTPIDIINNIEGLDWDRIAERVSDASSVKRNATDCRINWVANRHPRINHAEWLPAELSTLKSFVSAYQQRNIPVDWVEVSEKLGTNRIPIECMRQTLSRLRHNWIPDADQRLTRAVETYGIDNWQLVAREVSENATATQCQKRWYKSLDPSVKHGPWTAEEDDRLRKAVAGYDSSWIQVAATIPGRTNDQCRERWMERLQRGAQHDWTEDEDKILLDSVREIGNKWKEISMRIGNQKTGQACRQRHNKLKRAARSPKHSAAGSSTFSHMPLTPDIQTATTSTSSDISTPSLAENLSGGLPNFAQSPFPSVVSVAKLPPNPRLRAKEKEKELVQMDSSPAVSQPSTTTISTILEDTETSIPPDPAGTAMAKRKRKMEVPLSTEVDVSPALKRTRRTISQTELTLTVSKPANR